MALALKAAPPGRGAVRPVDGGLALSHRRSWQSKGSHWVAYTAEELNPVPKELPCPVCGVPARVPWGLRRDIAAAVSQERAGDT